MAHPSVEAIQLSSVTVPNDSILVPIGPARVYQNLVKLTRNRLGTDYPLSGFDVHFHLSREDVKDGSCEAQIDEEFYNMGEYFTMRSVQRGRLSFYAHFIETGPREQQREAASAFAIKNESEVESMAGSDYASAIEIEDSPPPRMRPCTYNKISQHVPSKVGMPRQGATIDGRREREDHAISLAGNYPALSVDATQVRFVADFQHRLRNGPFEDSTHATKTDFRAFSMERKRRTIHALLIDTDLYGALA